REINFSYSKRGILLSGRDIAIVLYEKKAHACSYLFIDHKNTKLQFVF
ncbi:MAG: hypothetical protein ACI9WM_001412, partial [Arenicella sp.]